MTTQDDNNYRSGHLIEFNNDEKDDWGITIKDKSVNTVRLDINITIWAGHYLSRNRSDDKPGACDDWQKSSALGCFEANVLLPLCDETTDNK